jgi:demethylmenaquinone methyltransferase/2-methoxy-6-polyprenyl-1,4-benzoquinol methylase
MSEATPRYARALLRLARPFPDFDVAFIGPLREEAVRLLRLKEGSRVVDAGCGMGGSFAKLVAAVGPSGEVVGVEISPETVVNARRRIEKNGWKNVEVIEAPAETVRLTGTFDGLLMLGAPDVYGSSEALANLVPHLRDGARIVFFGAKTSRARLGVILNPLLKRAFKAFSFSTTPAPDANPWRLVAPHVEGLEVEERARGAMFLASGTFVSEPRRGSVSREPA